MKNVRPMLQSKLSYEVKTIVNKMLSVNAILSVDTLGGMIDQKYV